MFENHNTPCSNIDIYASVVVPVCASTPCAFTVASSFLCVVAACLSHVVRQIHKADAVSCYVVIPCSLQLYDCGFFILAPYASSFILAIVFYS